MESLTQNHIPKPLLPKTQHTNKKQYHPVQIYTWRYVHNLYKETEETTVVTLWGKGVRTGRGAFIFRFVVF